MNRSNPKSNCTIFVGGITMTTKKGTNPSPNSPFLLKFIDDLVAYFEQYGTIYKVIIPVDDSKKCAEFKGYALVSFEDPAVLDTILSNPKHNILNRRVKNFI